MGEIMAESKNQYQNDITNLFNVYFEWVENLRKLDKEILKKYHDRILMSYDAVDAFFKTWMENNKENRHKYLKLLSEILKLA